MTNPLINDLEEVGLFSKPLTITLPTMGRFYPEELVEDLNLFVDLPVRPISILEESNFNDPFLLATGRGLMNLMESIVPDITEPSELSEVDIQAILIACRLASLGPEMLIKHVCQNPAIKENPEQIGAEPDSVFSCRETNELNLDLQEFIVTRYGPLSFIDEFTMVLTRIGQEIQLRPLPYRDTIKAMMDMMKSRQKYEKIMTLKPDDILGKPELVNDYAELIRMTHLENVDTLVECILFVKAKSGSVVTDRDMIKEWFMMLPIQETEEIRSRVSDLVTKMNELNQFEYQCSNCGFTNTVSLEMDTQKLFTYAGDSKMPLKSSAPSQRIGKKGRTSSRISRK